MSQLKNDFTPGPFIAIWSSVRNSINPDRSVLTSHSGIQAFNGKPFRKQSPGSFQNTEDLFLQPEFQRDRNDSYKSARILRVVKPEMKIKQPVKVKRLVSDYMVDISGDENSRHETGNLKIRNSVRNHALKKTGSGKPCAERKLNTCN